MYSCYSIVLKKNICVNKKLLDYNYDPHILCQEVA